MMRLTELISALQAQEREHGNIEISIDIIPTEDQPKEGFVCYFQAYDRWYANAQEEQTPSFEFNKDEQNGNWLQITFEKGALDGELERLDRKGLLAEVERNRKIQIHKPK